MVRKSTMGMSSVILIWRRRRTQHIMVRQVILIWENWKKISKMVSPFDKDEYDDGYDDGDEHEDAFEDLPRGKNGNHNSDKRIKN